MHGRVCDAFTGTSTPADGPSDLVRQWMDLTRSRACMQQPATALGVLESIFHDQNFAEYCRNRVVQNLIGEPDVLKNKIKLASQMDGSIVVIHPQPQPIGIGMPLLRDVR